MLRTRTETGWWLITHPDHARLAGAFAAAWGNALFRKPQPRERVLHGIASHDDGWAERDRHPCITREGKPSAFSTELVGAYSAFEEIDLADYLAVRERAVRMIAEKDAYAGLLIAMHTYNLLTVHADRSTIEAGDLPLLDAFLESQRRYQEDLKTRIDRDPTLWPDDKTEERISEHFCLLQGCDNLSLLACVDYAEPADMLHAFPYEGGGASGVRVKSIGPRHFELSPWPFAVPELSFEIPARHVTGERFATSGELETAYRAAPEAKLTVKLTSKQP